MAYVVLARKYRPQTFSDLIGQEHVTRTLGNAITHDRVHHAYLFCGARGLGKTTSARLLAKCLVCVEGPTPTPCNVCSECVAVTEGRSVDVIEIDGASNNRVDDVRNLRDQVRYLPQTARRKIYIIDEVHMLTGSAFNALLKTLEEPPEHVTFIFATTEVHELPATILSRVSRFDFRRLPSARLVEHMQRILRSEGVVIEEAGLFLVARAGGGSVRDSLTLLDKVIAFADESGTISTEEVRLVLGVPSHLAVAQLATAVLGRDADATLREFDRVVASGQDLQQLAIAFLQHLRNLVVVKLTASRDVLLDASEAEFDLLQEQAAPIEPSVLSQLFDRFSRVVDALAHTRVPRLILEMGFLDLVHAEPVLPLGGLIEQLEQISSGAPALNSAPRRSPSREISSQQPERSRQQRPSQGSSSPIPRESASPQSRPPAGPPRQEQRPSASAPEPRPSTRTPEPRPAARPPEPTRPELRPAHRPTQPVRGSDSGGDFSAALMRMGAESGIPGSGAPSAPQRHGHAQQGDHRGPPSHSHSNHAGPGNHASPGNHAGPGNPSGPGRSHGSPREPSRPAAKPEEPPEEPAEFPPWPPDQTSAAPQTPPSRQAPSPLADPGPPSQDDPSCATGACPGAPRQPSDQVIVWPENEPFIAWEEFLARIGEGEPQLHGALADMGLSSIGDGKLVLACPPDQHHRRSQIHMNKAIFQELAHAHLGAPYEIEIIDGEPELPGLPSLSLIHEQRRLALQRQVDQEARVHPGIRALVDSFDAQISSVKPLVSS